MKTATENFRAASSGRIEKSIELAADPARVWRALTDSREFGQWFCAKLEGPFALGQVARGHVTDPGYEHLTMEVYVEVLDPPRLFAFRWHPHAVDPAADYSAEPPTLVEFALAPTPAGTRLTVTEAGFNNLPAPRRDEAVRMNSEGWTEQLANLKAHLETH